MGPCCRGVAAAAAHDLVDPPGVRTQLGVNARRRRFMAAVGEPQDALQLAVAHQHAAVFILEAEGGATGRDDDMRSAM